MTSPIKAYREVTPGETGRLPMPLEEFGAKVGVKKSAVSKWEKGQQPSPRKALKIEAVTDGKIPRWMLRPDLWAPPPPAPKLEAAAQ